MEETFTKASGLWIDPLTKVSGRLKRSTPSTVGGTVRMLTKQVVDKVNDVYSFDPPLHSDDMVIDRYTGNTLPTLLS